MGMRQTDGLTDSSQRCLIPPLWWLEIKQHGSIWDLTGEWYWTTSQLSPATDTDVSFALSPRFSPSTVNAVPPSSGPDNGSSCSNTIHWTLSPSLNLSLFKDHCNLNSRLNSFVCRNIHVWNLLLAHVIHGDSVASFLLESVIELIFVLRALVSCFSLFALLLFFCSSKKII